ncbi:MAG TPA: hypothetical protein PL063_07195 [Candidatus Cloacimonadota bacterium]|jgi:hypothetical protein|nr:hypothetical protein [Candidatus Cloacimonadales bacterium]HPY96983.1 hypothetical protein [Candidatus Cloacimonadota bacterium]HQB41093.1 hypothetical protein [Candidatus Cloacimonadota bacterium]
MKKIITDYIIDEKAPSTNITKAPPIIKLPIVDEQKVSINTESDVKMRSDEPVLKLNRNQEGVVLSIEVQCKCGEKIIIKMDY